MSFSVRASLQYIFPIHLFHIKPFSYAYLTSYAFYWFTKCHYHICFYLFFFLRLSSPSRLSSSSIVPRSGAPPSLPRDHYRTSLGHRRHITDSMHFETPFIGAFIILSRPPLWGALYYSPPEAFSKRLILSTTKPIKNLSRRQYLFTHQSLVKSITQQTIISIIISILRKPTFNQICKSG